MIPLPFKSIAKRVCKRQPILDIGAESFRKIRIKAVGCAGRKKKKKKKRTGSSTGHRGWSAR